MKKTTENFLGKGEMWRNAGNQHFLLFQQSFMSFPETNTIFQMNLFRRLQMLSIWTTLKICHLIKS